MSRFENYNKTFCNIIIFWCIVLRKIVSFCKGKYCDDQRKCGLIKYNICSVPGYFSVPGANLFH